MIKLLIMILILSSCTTNAPLKEYKLRWNDKVKTEYLIKNIKENLTIIPLDAKEFNYSGDTVLFWANILVEMAYYESKWKPETEYKESFGVWSRGLFQLSLVDGKRYGCKFTTEKSVHNVKDNIECATLIMKKLVIQDKYLASRKNGKWLGGSRYWSTLRGTRTYTAKALKAIKDANKN